MFMCFPMFTILAVIVSLKDYIAHFAIFARRFVLFGLGNFYLFVIFFLFNFIRSRMVCPIKNSDNTENKTKRVRFQFNTHDWVIIRQYIKYFYQGFADSVICVARDKTKTIFLYFLIELTTYRLFHSTYRSLPSLSIFELFWHQFQTIYICYE